MRIVLYLDTGLLLVTEYSYSIVLLYLAALSVSSTSDLGETQTVLINSFLVCVFLSLSGAAALHSS